MSIWYILQLLDLETPLKSILTPSLFIEVLVAILSTTFAIGF